MKFGLTTANHVKFFSEGGLPTHVAPSSHLIESSRPSLRAVSSRPAHFAPWAENRTWGCQERSSHLQPTSGSGPKPGCTSNAPGVAWEKGDLDDPGS